MKRCNYINILIVLLISIYISNTTFGQESCRITLKSGSGYNFIFNSFQRYTDGISLTADYNTHLQVYWLNDNLPLKTWKIKVLESDNDGDALNIVGANSNNLLLTESLCIKAVNTGVDNAGAYLTLNPSTAWQDIVTGGATVPLPAPNDQDDILFYYYMGVDPSPCGGGKSFLGKPADFYSFDIIYELEAE